MPVIYFVSPFPTAVPWLRGERCSLVCCFGLVWTGIRLSRELKCVWELFSFFCFLFNTWCAAWFSGHDCAETVYLSVIRRLSSEHFDCVAVGEFSYRYDSAYFLAQFLVNSVNNPSALDDLELIRSADFDLANEILSTLDERLSAALKHIQFPEGWHLLASEQCKCVGVCVLCVHVTACVGGWGWGGCCLNECVCCEWLLFLCVIFSIC